ncbi:phytase [Vacuolonema iberomarrocanum]|uniref:phytase n=1 Tax=Vacuolonema iberomarrocanum TaxID=3454632 RepID=UPI003F6DD66D
MSIRFSAFNASLNRTMEGELIQDLSSPNNEQAQAVAEIIQRNNPDILLVNEFDYDAEGRAAKLFQENYLSVSQNGVDPVDYPYVYVAPSNTGIASGFDLNNDGVIVSTPGEPGYGNDAFGFGNFPGQFGMALFSKYPIETENIRTFQTFLWQDMPEALLPDDPETPEPNDWYSAEELEAFRLSSKSHWDVPINVDGETIHTLVSHPTPPVFDGPEDRNGTRNFDEIRFWADYVNGADYIYDDAGDRGGLEPGSRFVIMGDQNADPFDGDSIPGAIQQLLNDPLVNATVSPGSLGGPDAAERQGSNNLTQLGDPAYDTADFGEAEFGGPGNLRVDYVLPSANLDIADAGVFWPEADSENFDLVGDFPFPSSDHRLVFADVEPTREGASQDRVAIADIELLGEVSFATGTELDGTEIGGLSGIAYDSTRGVYYALADDRSSEARFYTLGINLGDGSLDDGDIVFQSVTQLFDESGNPFADGVLDPEGIALTGIGSLYISSEGDANQQIDPFVRQFSLTGQQISELPVPDKYLPTADQSSGIRNNLAFESLTLTPDQRYLYTATENALFQDGSSATLEDPSLSRILQYDLSTGQPVGEFVYEVDAIPDAPVPADGFATNGLVELLALDNNGTFLALERAFSVGVGNTVKLYQVNAQGALDVSDASDLFREDAVEVDDEILPPGPFVIDPAVVKTELLDIEADLGIEPDNLEGIALGPVLPDGRQSLILVSDNNFSDTQETQFIALALDLETTPAAQPVVETPATVDDEEGTTPLLGDSDDPAIWVHPTDPAASVVFATLKDGGLVSFDLQGNILETYRPADFGDIRYNNVDLIYDFTGLGMVGEFQTDLAVVSDRENGTLVILQIDPETGAIADVTSPDIPETIFGVDDGEATAYGLATYTSPVTGTSYAFVTQADGNLVAQLELIPQIGPADEVFVTAEVVRTLELPVPTGDPTDSQSEGLVIDQETGLLYVSLEDEVGILRASAEPDGGDDFTLVQPIDADYLVPDIEGLNIYYGPDGTGYLIANSQGDSSYAVFSREGTNEYLGSFVVGGNGDIDQVNESDGLDVINMPLGPDFPNGLLVLQDGANDPQNAVEDDEELENNSTNFKFVPWDSVAESFDNPLLVDSASFDPRDPQPQSLVNGVASGDVSQDSVVLWARSTFPGTVTFDYSTDPNFGAIAGTTTATVTDINQPVKVDITGLDSNTEYFYRVTDAAGDSETGRFQTAAVAGEQVGLTFGIAGDWQQAPPYPILQSVGDRSLDFFVKLGDTVYADLETPATPGVSQARTLEQFRAKHSEVLSPRFGLSAVSDLYQTTSVFATIDDHEVVDNFAGGAAPGESPDAPDIGSSPDPLFTDDVDFVNDTQAYEDAMQAYQEYHPIQDQFYDTPDDPRTDGERKLYRSQEFGEDAALFVLDSRSFRDVQLPPADLTDPTEFLVNAFDPTRTLLGRAQVDLLKQDLLAAEENGVTWKFVTIPEPIQNFGVANAEDRFEGYAAERTEILKFIDDNDIDNVVFMAGDFHGTIVNNLTYQEGPGQAQIATNAFEVVTGPVAFFDGRFGPNVANLSAAAGFITPEQLDFYNSLPVAPDSDSEINDRDDFIKQLLVQQTDLLGYDPVGLDNNLDIANGQINATLLQGDYLAAHNYSWTEFDIDPVTQALTVTTWGIDAYSEADVLADPDAVLNLTPTIISQFEVVPQGDRTSPDLAGQVQVEVAAGEQITLSGFGGVGQGAKISQDTIDELDTVQFIGDGLTAETMQLTQNGDDLEITFLGDETGTQLVLQDFALDQLDNLLTATGGTVDRGNILFSDESDFADSFDVFDADSTRTRIWNLNSVTFLNDLDNTVHGFGSSDDVINGLGGNDTLAGRSGNDTLRGGDGDDTLDGGYGDDIYTGGAGADVFVLNAGQGVDTITDFEMGSDRISLGSRLHPDAIQLSEANGNTLVQTATNEQLAVIEGITGLSNAIFI